MVGRPFKEDEMWAYTGDLRSGADGRSDSGVTCAPAWSSFSPYSLLSPVEPPLGMAHTLTPSPHIARLLLQHLLTQEPHAAHLVTGS